MKKRLFSLLLAVLLLGQTSAFAEGGVATAADMTTVENVVEEGMIPICAASLRAGEYPVAVDSSSSMFRIQSCVLRVEEGAMSALLTIGSSSYGYLYPGPAEEAAAASEEDWLAPEIGEDGSCTFTFPVEALDAGVPCAAFSNKKALWYDRTLVFRADSLPLEAFAEGTLTTAESLGLADGRYTVEVSLEGGSGRASVNSPTTLTVKDGRCTAEILWGSSNYDYMRVGEERFFPLDAEGNSRFEIPVSAFDTPLAVVADTTAMSKSHEIDYSLRFSSASLRPAENPSQLSLQYAEQFSVDFCPDGSAKLTVAGTERYRILPKGANLPADLAADETVLYQPVERAYLASSAAADLFLALDALDHGCGHAPGEVRVFGEVFEVSSAQRGALDIHGRAEHNGEFFMLAAVADGFAHGADELGVKRGGCGGRGREADRLDAVVHTEMVGFLILLAQAVRAVADHGGRDAEPVNGFGMPEVAAG